MRARMHRELIVSLGLLVLLGTVAGPSMAEDPSAEIIEALQRQLDERDALIADLLRRVEALEQGRTTVPSVDEAAAAAAPPPPEPPPEDDIDEELVARALERTLVREGGILLRPWSLEIEPRLSYTFRGLDALQIVEIEGEPRVAAQRVRRDIARTTLGLRLGLPWNAQVQLSIPYVFGWEETVTAGVPETRRESGLGDIELGLSKQLLYEPRSGFDLLGNVFWSSKTGRRDLVEGVALGSGFHALGGNLTAVKRRDPLVFVGTAYYTTYFEETQAGREVEPGDEIGLRVGTILAASPDASVRFAFDLSRSRDTEVDGERIRGSGTTIGMLEIGAAAVLGPRTLFGFEVGVGVTDDAPDYRLGTSLSYRFR
jgi:hypothetical protein